MHTTPDFGSDSADPANEHHGFAPFPPLPPHQVPRVIVNCLAVLVGLAGVLWILALPVMLAILAAGRTPARPIYANGAVVMGLLAVTLAMAVMGYLVLRNVWIHWRRPDRQTATEVVRMASFALWLYLLQLVVGRNAIIPKLEGIARTRLEGACVLGLILACYLLYRFVLKPLVSRAYPA